jgi:hypothetical protein
MLGAHVLRTAREITEMNFDDVDEFAAGLPGVTVGVKWGHRTWLVHGKGFAWQRPFSKADLKRFGDQAPPQGEILAVRVESLDAKDALLEIAPPGFFTIPHFDGYAGVLIALRKARVKDVRAAILDAFRAMSADAATSRPRTRKRPRVARRRAAE